MQQYLITMTNRDGTPAEARFRSDLRRLLDGYSGIARIRWQTRIPPDDYVGEYRAKTTDISVINDILKYFSKKHPDFIISTQEIPCRKMLCQA